MPRQVTRALDKLKQPVRKAVLSGGLDRDILEDDSLITGLSDLQTKQVGLNCCTAVERVSSAQANLTPTMHRDHGSVLVK